MKQHRPTTKRHVIKSADTVALLAQLSSCGDGAEPVQVIGWSRKGIWTRVRANYPNGWELVVNFDRSGGVSSHSAKISLHAMIRGKEVEQ